MVSTGVLADLAPQRRGRCRKRGRLRQLQRESFAVTVDLDSVALRSGLVGAAATRDEHQRHIEASSGRIGDTSWLSTAEPAARRSVPRRPAPLMHLTQLAFNDTWHLAA